MDTDNTQETTTSNTVTPSKPAKNDDVAEMTQDEVSKEIVRLLRENNKYLRRYVSVKHVLLRGMATGLGGFLGATILISLLFAFLSKMSVVPVIGTFIANIIEFLHQNYPTTGY